MLLEKKELSISEVSQGKFISLGELMTKLNWSRGLVEGLLEQKGYPFFVLFGKNLIVSMVHLKEIAESTNLDISVLNN